MLLGLPLSILSSHICWWWKPLLLLPILPQEGVAPAAGFLLTAMVTNEQ
jgi:hypothetical protein